MVKNLHIDDCLELLGNNYIGRLSYVFGKSPYTIPITYYHDRDEKCLISYASEGHKIDAMRLRPMVNLQVDEVNSVQDWRSVLILGKFEELKGSAAKMQLHKFALGVQESMGKKQKTVPQFIKDFSSKMNDRGLPIVYRILISDILGKYRNDTA